MTMRDRSGIWAGLARTPAERQGRRSRVSVAVLLPVVVVSGLSLATCSGGGAAAPAAQVGTAAQDDAGAFCSTARKVLTLEVGLQRGQLATREDRQARVSRTDALLDALVAEAPTELRASATVVRASTQRVVAELARVDYDASKMNPRTIFAVTGEPGYQRAAQAVIDHVQNSCGGITPAPAPAS